MTSMRNKYLKVLTGGKNLERKCDGWFKLMVGNFLKICTFSGIFGHDWGGEGVGHRMYILVVDI